MTRTNDFNEACRLLFEKGTGAFIMSDGAVVVGSFLNAEDKYDSPSGIPCIYLRTTDNTAVGIAEDVFESAVFDAPEDEA